MQIGKYEVLERVASGGMGAVYRARDTENGGEVALKVMSPELAAQPAMKERFKREINACLKLRHDNIVALLDHGETESTCFLVMEFVKGIDLHEYIDKKGALNPEESRQIALQTARALQHAHDHGIVHRDIKPSNLLLTRRDGELLVKLADFGLARKASNEEFRVTRSGTTVGTVDYLSPEQARDSSMADTRSDLYSLGCTWFHMLAGEAPFPEGGLAERLLKHMTAEPPDLRTFNPRVSDELVRILGKLLAKQPAERYQEPQELIHDLLSLDPVAKSRPGAPARGRKSTARKSGPSSPRSLGTTGKKRFRLRRFVRRNPIAVYTAAAAVLLVCVLVLVLSARQRSLEQVNGESVDAPRSVAGVLAEAASPSSPEPEATPKPLSPRVEKTSTGQGYARLYPPSKPIDAVRIRREFTKPWEAATAPASAGRVLQVSRVPAKSGAVSFTSLAAAFQAAAAEPAARTVVIEINDSGPLFEAPARVADRHVAVRAAKGVRPLVVWNVQTRTAEGADDGRASTFFDVQRGSLTLEGLDLVLQWPERRRGTAAFARVADGDFTADSCTFSLAGRAPDGVTVARLTGESAEGKPCRLTRCIARGASLAALDLQRPGIDALLDNCLVAGGGQALVQARATDARPVTVRCIRSTLICGRSLVQVVPAAAVDRTPQFAWMSWDCLLAHDNRLDDSDMVAIGSKAGTQGMRWEATNCLYTGWQTLLADDRSYGPRNISDWRAHWGRLDGDDARISAWPANVPAELAEVPSTFFHASGPVLFASSSDPEKPLGCDLEQLPPAHTSWLGLTYDRFVARPVESMGSSGPPEIPTESGDAYQGEKLDLDQVGDLGQHLRLKLQSQPFAPRVVLRVRGSGAKATSHFRVPRGTTLVLYFEPSSDKAQELSLAANDGSSALFETEDSSLDLIGANLRVPEQFAGLGSLLKARGGDLRLQRCQLQGPLSDDSGRLQSLVQIQGSGSDSADSARVLLLERCVLVTAGDAIQVSGIGARVNVSQSLLVAGDHALALAPGPGYRGRANIQCALQHTTLAARSAAVLLSDVRDAPTPVEPIVVQTTSCAFMNPYPGARPGVLVYGGTALQHGLLVWQGDGDGFQRQLYYWAASAESLPEKAQGPAAWSSLWGPHGRLAQTDLALSKGFDKGRWDTQLDRLVFSGTARNRPGADLADLGIKKKTR